MKRVSILLPLLVLTVGNVTTKTEVIESNKVLISIDGKPYLTETGFEEFLNQVIESEPQLSIYMQMDPDGIRTQLLEAKKREAVMDKWAEVKKVRERDSYKKQRKIGEKALDSMLVHTQFVNDHKKEATDADARKYYDEHKDKDPNLGTPGGIKSKGVKFMTEEEAKNFAKKLEQEKHDIDKLAAQDDKLQVQDFGVVSDSGFSFVDPTLKDKIVQHKKFPAHDIVKLNDKEYWVAVALGEQKPEYEPFSQVKDAIKQQLSNKKVEEMFEEKVPQLEKEYKIKVHTQNVTKQAKPEVPGDSKTGQAKQEALPKPIRGA